MRRLRLREMTEAERTGVEKLAHSRTAPVRQVERARIIWQASQDRRAPAIAAALRLTAHTVRGWIKRVNAQGLAGLEDQPRVGRPPTYTPKPVGVVIATALTDPKTLDLPFASWPLDRLAAYLNEHEAIAIKRSRLDEILQAEGLRWRRHETWFGERVDPAFAAKGADRGPLHRPAGGRRRRLPGRDGAGERQELPRPSHRRHKEPR
jgi:transposase